jgi:hypothetical protein
MTKKIPLIALTLLFVVQCQAVDKYWRPINSDYHQSYNWDPVGIPTGSDRIIFDNFGNVDCVISSNITVAGWLQYNNYFETVSILPGVNVTVGAQHFFMDSGGLFCDSGFLDVNGNFQVVGGGFLSPTGGLYVSGDFELNPYPLGGWFTDSGGTVHFDGTSNTDILQSASLQHIAIAKGASKMVNCSAGIFLRATDGLTITSGYISGPGTFEVSKTCYIGPSAQGGNGPLVFNDHFPGYLIMDHSSLNLDQVWIDKPNAADSVYLQSNNASLGFLTANDSLFIKSGYFCVDHPNTTFVQLATTIDPTGVLVASTGDLFIQEDVYNNGQFHHANGHLHLSAATYTFWDTGSGIETFWNLSLSKSTSRDVTVAPGDQFVVENRLNCNYGYFNGSTSTLSCQDTVYFGPSHQEGTINFEFVSSKISNAIFDHPVNSFNSFQINKNNPSDQVFFETGNASLSFGDNASDAIQINTGHLGFQNVGTQVDWNTLDVTIAPNGTLDAWSGLTRFSGNLHETGGAFVHNSGDWHFDAATNTVLDVTSPIRFYDVMMEKSTSRTVTLGSTDVLIAENLYYSNYGLLHGSDARLEIEKDAYFGPSHQRGTVPVFFTGSGTGIFTCDHPSLTHVHMEIDKSDPSDIVYFQTNNAALSIGSIADEEVFITTGTLAFQNCGTHVDWNYLNTHIAAQGTFVDWGGTTYFSGNLFETGGSFEHNSGLFVYDAATYTVTDVSAPLHFYDLEMAKSTSRTMTLATGDMVVVENNYFSNYGLFHGADAFLHLEKDATFGPSHQRGSVPVIFTGSNTGIFTCNHTGLTHLHMEIDKDNPTDMVFFQTSNPALTIGNNADEEVFITTGTLAFQNCGTHLDWNFLNTHIAADGTFVDWSGTTYFSGNLFETGGSFEHNNGLFIYDAATYTVTDVTAPLHFYDLEMAKSSSRTMTLSTGDLVVVDNNYLSSYGLFHGADAFLHLEKNATFGPSHQRGSVPVFFTGSSDGIFTCNHASLTHLHMEINKDDPSDMVFFQTGNAYLTIGSISDEEVFITRGSLAFQNCGLHVDWNFLNTHIALDGTLVAWNGSTYFSGNLFETGGTFNHNNGEFIFDAATYTVTDVINPLHFYNLELAKNSSRTMTLGDGDEIVVENLYTSRFGYLNGPLSVLKCEKDATFMPSHQRGSIPLKFTGPLDGVFTINTAGLIHADVEVIKSSPTAQLSLTKSSSPLAVGTADDHFTLTEGTVNVLGTPLSVNWNVLDTDIAGGTWICYSGTTNWNQNLNYTGGTWDHNMGEFVFSGAFYSTMDFVLTPHFYDAMIIKLSSRTITLGVGQSMVVENQMLFGAGLAHGGEIQCLSDVEVASTWGGGTSQLSFVGSSDQNFDLPFAATAFEGVIELNKPSGNVILQSDLTIEDNFAQLSFVKGLLTSSLPGTNVVRFSPGVDTGWSGGNNDSYIAGPVEKQGTGNIFIPTGDNGVFAPCGIADNNPTNTFVLEYHNESPQGAGYGNIFGAGLDHVSSCEYWTIDYLAGAAAARAILSYDTNRCGPIDNPSALRVAVWESGQWENRGLSADDGYYITSSLISDWNVLTLGSTTPENPMTGAAVPCVADYNLDGTRNTADLLILLSEFGCTSSCVTDLDGNDATNTADLLILLSVFGLDCP